MNAVARPFALVLAALAVASLVACSAGDTAKTKPTLPTCDEAESGSCPGVKDNLPKEGKGGTSQPSSGGPTDDPVPGEEPASEQTNADAGSAPTPGKACTALDACCKQLADAGYDTATCKSVVSTVNEDACFAQHDRYKSFGDCS